MTPGASLPFVPRGLSRDLAALYIGVPVAAFERLVEGGQMPRPREIGGVLLWDRIALDAAFDAIAANSDVRPAGVAPPARTAKPDVRSDRRPSGMIPSTLRQEPSTANAVASSSKLLSTSDVLERLNIGGTTLWRMEKRGQFPKALMLGRRCKRWRVCDVEVFEQSASGLDLASPTDGGNTQPKPKVRRSPVPRLDRR